MKLGLFTALLSEMPFDAVIRLVRPLGIQALEFSTGNFGRPAHIDLGLADHVLSIEHEGSLISAEKGLAKATSFPIQWVIKERPKTIWWTLARCCCLFVLLMRGVAVDWFSRCGIPCRLTNAFRC
jgi:hypothetical protein